MSDSGVRCPRGPFAIASALVLAAGALFAPAVAEAQFARASLTGTVTDDAGLALPGSP